MQVSGKLFYFYLYASKLNKLKVWTVYLINLLNFNFEGRSLAIFQKNVFILESAGPGGGVRILDESKSARSGVSNSRSLGGVASGALLQNGVCECSP